MKNFKLEHCDKHKLTGHWENVCLKCKEEKEMDWELIICDKCMQMTNHDEDGCLKCKARNRKEK